MHRVYPIILVGLLGCNRDNGPADSTAVASSPTEQDRLLIACLEDSGKRGMTPSQARTCVRIEPTFDSGGRWEPRMVSLLRLVPDGTELPDFAKATEVIYWKRPLSEPARGEVRVAGLSWQEDGKPRMFLAAFVLP